MLGQYTAVAGSRAYDPWGTVTVVTGTFSGLLGFQSAWSDAAAGKSLMRARWYDPGAGDFTSADTVQVSPVTDPAAGNSFAYAADGPLDHADPSGHRVVGLPGDDGNTPMQAAQVIYTSQLTAARTGAAVADAQRAASLAEAAKKSHSPTAAKAAAALNPKDKPNSKPKPPPTSACGASPSSAGPCRLTLSPALVPVARTRATSPAP